MGGPPRQFTLACALASLSGCSALLSTDGYTSGCAKVAPPPGYDSSQLVFEDSFCSDQLDASKWITYIPGLTNFGTLQPPLSAPNAGHYDAAYWAPSQVVTHDGVTLTAAADTSVSGYTAKSGVLCTCGTRQFSGTASRTYLQVRAKVPAKDGMWPTVALESVAAGGVPAIALLSTGFIDGTQGTPLENVDTKVDGSEDVFFTGTDLSAEYTDYGVEIVWGQSITWSWGPADGARQQIHQANTGSAMIPDPSVNLRLRIELNVINGLEGSSTWHTVWNGSDSDAFQVSSVQVYER